MHRRTIINPKNNDIFSSPPSVHESRESELNRKPWPLYLYLSGSAFLFSFTAPDKQLSSVKSVFKSFNHVANLYEILNQLTFYEEKTNCLVLNRFL